MPQEACSLHAVASRAPLQLLTKTFRKVLRMATAGPWSEMEKTLSKPLGVTVKQTLEALGFESMTPVQAATIPLFLAYKVRRARQIGAPGAR